MSTKEDVDKYCQSFFKSISSERERNVRSFSIAQKYFDVHAYESARQYVTRFLSTKNDSSVGHTLLAQCYEYLGKMDKALSSYKYSILIHPDQPALVLRVCGLLAENRVTVDEDQIKFWLERGEPYFPYHPSILELKQKCAASCDRLDESTSESAIMDELSARPDDPFVNCKFLRFLIEKARVEEAYKTAFAKMPTFIPTLQWYQTGVVICKMYQNQYPNFINEDFYGNYLLVLERALALSSQDIKPPRKSIAESIFFLSKFDEVLSTASSLHKRSDVLDQLINHMAGQFCYHIANLLFRRTKRDEYDARELGQFVPLLLLLSTSENFAINIRRKQDTVLARTLAQCSHHSNYRISQAGFVLLSRCKDSLPRDYVEGIFRLSVTNWKERVLAKLYTSPESRDLCTSSFLIKCTAFTNLPIDLPSGLIENVERFVSATQTIQPDSLHHMVWLGMQYLARSEKQSICDRVLPLKFRSTCFESLQFAPSSVSSSIYAESLSQIDVEAFLCASVYSADSALPHSLIHKVSATPTVPADVSQTLCTQELLLWWESAYHLANKTVREEIFQRVRSIVQRGIEAVRLNAKDNLPLPILVLLGRTFVNKAAVEPNGDLASVLENRALLYWKSALPSLERMTRDEPVNCSANSSMFGYYSSSITKGEATKLFNEGKRFLDMHSVKSSDYGTLFSSGTTPEYNIYTESAKSPAAAAAAAAAVSGGSRVIKVVDQEKLCTLLEQNAKIIDQLDTITKKQESYDRKQDQLVDTVSLVANKLEVFILESWARMRRRSPSPRTSAVTSPPTSQIDAPTFGSLGAPQQLAAAYQHPFSNANIQTSFPMYPPAMPPPASAYAWPPVVPPYIPPPYMPQTPTSSFARPNVPPQLPLPTFDFLSGYPTPPSLTLPTPACQPPAVTAVTTTSWLPADLSRSNSVAGSSSFSTTSVQISPSFSSQYSTPMTAASNASPSHSFQIKLPELSSILKSPPVQIPEETADSDDEKRVVEHDPIPDFKPIIPLPDEITVTTGEEGEEVLFESRSKLYRWADKEWKERGIGMFKVLQSRDTGRVRILMRREIVHKICANHFLAADMKLTPMTNSDRAWVYCAPDFSNEEMMIEKLCVKFKSPEIAAEFKDIFDKYKALDGVTASPSAAFKDVKSTPQTPDAPVTGGKADPLTPAASPRSQNPVNASKKIVFTPPSLNVVEADKEVNPAPRFGFSFKSTSSSDTKVVTESKPAPPFGTFSSKPVTTNEETAPEPKSIFGGFTFKSPLILSSTETEKPKTEEKPKNSPFAAFSFGQAAAPGSLFGSTPATSTAAPGSFFDSSSITSTAAPSSLFGPSPVTSTAAPGSLLFGSSSITSTTAAPGSLFGSSSITSASTPSSLFSASSITSTPEAPKPSSATPFTSLAKTLDSSSVKPTPDASKASSEAPFASVRDTVDFSSFTKNSPTGNAFVRSENFKGFAGAGSRLFTSSSPAQSASSPSAAVSAILKNLDSSERTSVANSEGNSSVSGSAAEESEFVPTAEFAPVVPLPELVEVKTGEEGLNLLYEDQCKLFRYVGKEWKERGVGKMKIFQDPKDGSVRMLMRRDQVHKVCCNQRLTADVELSPMKTNNKAWTWSNQDFSEGELKNELLCIRFKTQEQADAFKKAFENGKELSTNTTPAPSASSNTQETKPLPSLAEQFKRDPSTWDCEVCYVRNPKEAKSCSACTTPRDGVTAEPPSSSSAFGSNTSSFFGSAPKTEFKFGMPSTTSAPAASSFSFGNYRDPSKETPVTSSEMVFSFGPITTAFATTTAVSSPMFSFGNMARTTTSPSTPESLKSVSGSSLFGSPNTSGEAATASKPKENISIFSGNPIKPADPSSTFSSFSFKLDDGQPQAFGSRSVTDGASSQPTSLYRQVPFLIRDENDKLLLKSPAKLFRFASSGEWEARGVGHVQILLNVQLNKCRLLMFREPACVVACLNHYLHNGVTFATQDQRSWIWCASDFSEGEIVNEKFCLTFDDDADASAFESTLKNIGSADVSGKSSSTDDVEFVSETQTSEEDRKLAESLQLPTNYFAYKYSNKSCSGCPGCEPEDLQNLIVDDGSSERVPALIPLSSKASDDATSKAGFVFGASASSSWNKPAFSFGNLLANTATDSSPSQPSTSEVAEEKGGSDDEEVRNNDNDPYFEPVIPLPDIVDTKTGEEEETIIFTERAKLFRYDQEKKEWKERGIGDLKLLYHPAAASYRLLLRREQVHKVVLNQRLTPTFTLQPLSSSKNSVCWFGMNFSDESDSHVLEKLAARFKTEETLSRFEKAIEDCVSKLNDTQADGEVSDDRANEIDSAEQGYTGGTDTAENDDGGRADEYNVEEYGVEYQDYVDEQGIQDAMQDVVDYYDDTDSLFECAATLQVLEDDITVDYTGVAKIFMGLYSESGELNGFVDFSTDAVPSLYTAGITKESVAIHEGDTVTFPLPSETDSESKAIFRFPNEALADDFYGTFLKMKLCDADPAKFLEEST